MQTVSINTQATLLHSIKWTSYSLLFLCAYIIGQSEKSASKILKVIIVSTLGYVLYGLALEASGSKTILGLAKVAYTQDLTSTFVNRNAFAIFTGLGLVVIYGRFIRHTENLRNRYQWMKFISSKYGIIFILSIITMLTGLLLTHSRAGIGATFLTLYIMTLLSNIKEAEPSKKKKKRWNWKKHILPIAIIVISILLISDTLWQRTLQIGEDHASRLEIYRAVWQATLENVPFFGTGLGTFEDAFHTFKPEYFPYTEKTYSHAHNVYLELMFEIGIPATLVWLFLHIYIIRKLWDGFKTRKRDKDYPLIAIGAYILISTHSLVDFSISIPSVAVVFTLLIGIGLAQSTSSRAPTTAPQKAFYIFMALTLVSVPLTALTTSQAQKAISEEIWISNQPDTSENRQLIPAGVSAKNYNKAALLYSKYPLINDSLKIAEKLNDKSLLQAPTSPHAWLTKAHIAYLNGKSNENISSHLTTSYKMGPYERALVWTRLQLAFDVWDMLSPQTQKLIKKDISRITPLRPHEMMKAFPEKRQRTLIFDNVAAETRIKLEELERYYPQSK